jgi:hypothetical protein
VIVCGVLAAVDSVTTISKPICCSTPSFCVTTPSRFVVTVRLGAMVFAVSAFAARRLERRSILVM